MILDEIVPIHPIAEHLMVMAKETIPMDFINETAQLRKLLAEYKNVGPKNRVQPQKSYIKIIKDVTHDEAIVIRGPWMVDRGQYQYVYIYPCSRARSIRLMYAWDSPIRNARDQRIFFNIYEIPNELYYELATLTEQWLKQSTTN